MSEEICAKLLTVPKSLPRAYAPGGFYIKNIMPACQKGRFLHLTHR